MKRGISRRSQIPATVFVYALAAIIIAFIMIFGYKAIGTLGSTASKTETAKFKTDVKNIIIEDTSYGKNDFIKLGIPPGYEELCFVAAVNVLSMEQNARDIISKYPQAVDVAESPNNVFLADLEGDIDPFFVEAFRIDGDLAAVCVKQESGELRFRIQGKGDHALIIPVS
ncbi:MAG: hypothetical protein KKE20_02445 [Nanoarchaeota archaeon]|nr:hypothetical protein [Nanoarchaeota archaeon]